MKCLRCGKTHEKKHPHFQLEPRLSDRGFPTHDPKYPKAHKEANREEKSRFGKKGFSALGRIDNRLGNHELAGKNTKSGKIEVSAKVPKKYRSEVAFHEKVENKILRKKK